jgi:hypothetical protein
MAQNTQEPGNHVALNQETADNLLTRESDRDARRLQDYTDERGLHAASVERNRRSAGQALAELFPSESDQSARSSDPEMLQSNTPQTGISLASESRLPLEPPHSLTNTLIAGASSGKGFGQDESARLLATLVGPTKPDSGMSVPTDVVLDKYAQTVPVTPPPPRYAGPFVRMEQVSDVISQQVETGVESQEARGAAPGAAEPREGRRGDEGELPFAVTAERGPVKRPTFPQMVQQDPATELTMSKALTRDRRLGYHAIGSGLPGLPEAVDPVERRRPAINAPAMIEPNAGSASPVSPWAGTPARSSGTESMAAATEELERLRSTARRTADELEKIRGPVTPAFPARPPVFRDRS